MENSEYWQQRFTLLEESQNKKANEYLNILKEEYEKSLSRIEKDITNWYVRLADNNEISLADAKKMLDKKELQEFKWTVEEYIQKGKENAVNQKWITELENASARVHIDKLEAMKIQIQNELEQLAAKQDKDTTDLLKNQYENAYYKSAFEIQKGLERYWNIQPLDTDKIKKIISKPWTTDNKTFSNRIWNNKENLLNTLQKDLTQAIVRGDDIQNVISKIEKDFKVSKNRAGTLVMTESAFFSSIGQKECFNSLGVKKYENVATLDKHTSEICQEMDGTVFDMKDYQVGITAPPFHCNCRTTTVPYFNDEFTESEKRVARDENGKTMYVDSKMKYKEWKEKYINNETNTSTNNNKNDKINTIKNKEEKIVKLQNILVDMNEARRKHWELTLTSKEDIEKLPQLKEMSFSVDLKNIDEKIIDTIIDNYKTLGDEYYTTLNHIGVFDDQDLLTRPNSGGYAFTKAKTLTGEIHFNQNILNDFDEYVETMKRCSEYGHIPKNINPENYKYYVSTHEFAHSIYNSNMLEKNLIGMNETIYKDFYKELRSMFENYKVRINDIDSKIKELNTKFVLNTEKFTTEDSKILKRLKAEKEEIFVSNYAVRDNLEDEFMAECFSEAKLSKNPSKTAKDVIELIDKYFKR